MIKLTKKFKILHLLIALICIFNCFNTYSENKAERSLIIYNVNPYYKYWKNNFIVYVDNYLGDINNVSINDLKGDKGTSYVYIFSKLTDGNYNYDTLLSDIKNTDIVTNLHDKKPILVHLPKSANNNESHALLKNDDEKGKLVTGGPYSKYQKYSNGFYYKDKRLDNRELNKLLSEYKVEADKISKKLNQISSFSIKDLYSNVHAAYMTNGSTSAAGTLDAKIYLLNVDKKFNPYTLSISDIITNDIISGVSTKDFLPDWQIETLYIYNGKNELIEKLSFEDFRQFLWYKQDKSVLEWMVSLNH